MASTMASPVTPVSKALCPRRLTTALRTELGTTLVIGVVKHTTAYTAYFRCVLLDQRMQESLRQAKSMAPSELSKSRVREIRR
jgi:hypothetical protein